jgi:valyl-tRNA synthetase
MPFLTEEINEKLVQYSSESHQLLITSSWTLKTVADERTAKETIQILQDTVRIIRDFRSQLGLDPREPLQAVLEVDSGGRGVESFLNEVKTLGCLSLFQVSEKFKKPSGNEKWVGRPVKTENSKGQVWIGLAKEMDFAQMLTRLEKTLKERKNFITSVSGKLSNENFVARAPQDVIEKERQKLIDAQWESERLSELIFALKS